MDPQQFFLEIFAFVHSLFGLVLGVVVVQLVIFLLLSKLLEDSKNPQNEGGAILGYTMLAVATVLMSVSAILATISIMGGTLTFASSTYFALVLIFAVGGLLYLWNDHRLHEIPESAKKVPRVIFFYSIKAIGQLSIVLSALYLCTSIVLQNAITREFWSIPITLLLYGSVLCILTKQEAPKKKPARKKKK